MAVRRCCLPTGSRTEPCMHLRTSPTSDMRACCAFALLLAFSVTASAATDTYVRGVGRRRWRHSGNTSLGTSRHSAAKAALSTVRVMNSFNTTQSAPSCVGNTASALLTTKAVRESRGPRGYGGRHSTRCSAGLPIDADGATSLTMGIGSAMCSPTAGETAVYPPATGPAWTPRRASAASCSSMAGAAR